MSIAHWMYLLGLVALIATVVAKRNVIAPAMIATFLTGVAYSGSVTTGLGAVFNAAIIGTRELLPIFIIIALVTAMLGAVRNAGADTIMIRPLRGLFRNGHISYLVLAVVTFLLSLSFWPTPVLPLIAAILLPAAVRVGLPPFGAALAIAIAGQGMALSSDLVMGVAPALSAEGAGVSASLIANRATIIALIAGVVALTIAYLRDVRTKMLDPVAASEVTLPVAEASAGPVGPIQSATESGSGAGDSVAVRVRTGESTSPTTKARLIAIAVPALFAVLLAYMLLGRFTPWIPNVDEGLGAPLVGGAAALALVAISFLDGRKSWLGDVGEHFTDGITFAFRSMGMVIPVAGFVYMGLSDYSGAILDLPPDAPAPGFLIDAVASVQPLIPQIPVFAAFAMLLIGMVIGLDGSGWPGLPFTGSLAASLGEGSGADVATLAAIAQNGASWTGGGTLVIWSSLIVVAGLTGVSVMDLARRLFVPVVCGLVVATSVVSIMLL
ncbi:permease [Mycolicibacterium vanbaalenii]|uniref:permease n=1 Tax=Mycolicibacterium vanbaalenii TaxID=110539 RepID=UPI001F2E81D6|nr:permease [Mycolicibacterium vanbaalenii]